MTGVALRAEHLGAEDSRAIPTREANGEITNCERPQARPSLPRYNEGRKFLSIEFHSRSKETRSKSGVREIQQAFLCPVRGPRCRSPEYKQATAEVRTRQRRVWL